MKLLIIKGHDISKIPYIVHRKTPTVNIRNITREISFVFFVFQILTTWGRKEPVVSIDDTAPIIRI